MIAKRRLYDAIIDRVAKIAAVEPHNSGFFFYYADKGASRFWEESVEVKSVDQLLDDIVDEEGEYEEGSGDVVMYLREHKSMPIVSVQIWSSVSAETSRKIAEIILDIMKTFPAIVEINIADSDRSIIFDPNGTMYELAWYGPGWVEIRNKTNWHTTDFIESFVSDFCET